MNNAKEFIAVLSDKLGRPFPSSAPEKITVKVPNYELKNNSDLVSKFIETWEALGGKALKAKTSKDVVEIIRQWFGEQPDWLNHQSIIAWNDLPSVANDAFRELDWSMRSYANLPVGQSDRTAAVAQAAIGVTGADWGLARSGSLVLNSGKGRGRAVSLVPPRHLSFVKASTFYPDIMGLMEELDRIGNPPASVEIISGPSRTSDIEMDLSIGVHGPIEVYTIIIED